MFMKCVKLLIKLACNCILLSIDVESRLKTRFDSYEKQFDFRSSSGHVRTESHIRGHMKLVGSFLYFARLRSSMYINDCVLNNIYTNPSRIHNRK